MSWLVLQPVPYAAHVAVPGLGGRSGVAGGLRGDRAHREPPGPASPRSGHFETGSARHNPGRDDEMGAIWWPGHALRQRDPLPIRAGRSALQVRHRNLEGVLKPCERKLDGGGRHSAPILFEHHLVEGSPHHGSFVELNDPRWTHDGATTGLGHQRISQATIDCTARGNEKSSIT